MIQKKKTPAGGGTPTEAMVETAALAGATISYAQDTTDGAARQPHGKIFDLLSAGEENAVPARDLANLTGISPRGLRRAIDDERERGVPILASDSGYYWPAEGPEGVRELRAFLRRQDARCAANRRVVAPLRRLLRAAECGPIPGQFDLWEGGGGDGTAQNVQP